MEIAEGSQIFYQDDFSDTATGWPEGNNWYDSTYYKDGRYWIESNDDNYYVPRFGNMNLEDVILAVNIKVEQSSTDGEYGLICRYLDDDNMYMFEITQDGYYAIYKLYNGSWSPLIDYTYSSLVDALDSADIQASCIGNTLRLAVNGKLLGEVQDSAISAGDYGFFAGTFYNKGNIVSFDDLVVSQP